MDVYNYDVVLKNSKWMEKLYKNRKSYYKNIVIDQIHKIEENSLLNALASEGIYVSMDDFIEWQKNGTKPSEFFNNKTKSVMLKDTAEYDAYYELFRRADELKEISEKVKSAEDVIKETDKTIRDKTIIVNTYESLINEKDLYNKIYKLFEINSLNNLSNEEFSNLSEEEEINLFNLFLKTSVPAKNLIDEHNKNKNLDEITKETGTIEDFYFDYNGNTQNTKTYDTKRAITTMINRFKTDLNKLNKITEKTEKEIEEINNLTILIRDFGKLMNTKFPDTKVETTTTTTTTDTKADIEKEKSTITDSELKDLERLVIFFLENPKEPTVSGSVVVRYPALFKAITDIEERRKDELGRVYKRPDVGFLRGKAQDEAIEKAEKEINAEYDRQLAALKTNVVPENAESSDDVESPAVESGQKTINTDDPNRYTVEKLKIDLEKVTNKKEYEIFLINVFQPNIQNMIVDDVAEMSSLMRSKVNSFENLNDIKIDIKKLEKESQIVSKVDIITPNKSNFSANFTFVVTKVDDNNKVVTIKPLGSEELISLSFDDIANKFDLKETIENLTESSKETLNDEVKEYVNETNDVLDAFLVNKKQTDKIIEGVSSKKIKDTDKDLLDNLDC